MFVRFIYSILWFNLDFFFLIFCYNLSIKKIKVFNSLCIILESIFLARFNNSHYMYFGWCIFVHSSYILFLNWHFYQYIWPSSFLVFLFKVCFFWYEYKCSRLSFYFYLCSYVSSQSFTFSLCICVYLY